VHVLAPPDAKKAALGKRHDDAAQARAEEDAGIKKCTGMNAG
jgi:hypothetical protein